MLLDPYIEKNLLAPRKLSDFNPDVIAVTHGHLDHLGDAGNIARKTGCLVVGTPEISMYLSTMGAWAEGMNISGSFRIGDCTSYMTYALHSSGIIESNLPVYGGEAVGFVIDDGVRIYHSGDTVLFSDMKLIGELHRPDVALFPIGGRFTMGPGEAAIATNWIRPAIAISMHYDTNSSIHQNPGDFQALVETLCDTEIVIMEVGETIEC